MKAVPAVQYLLAKRREAQEQLNLEYYKTTMLLYIAQPTRKYPQNLPQYKRLSDTTRQDNKPDKSGEQLLFELLES